jgi:hypothetical protein
MIPEDQEPHSGEGAIPHTDPNTVLQAVHDHLRSQHQLTAKS